MLESTLEKAVLRVKNGEKLRAVCCATGTAPSTLCAKVNGSKPMRWHLHELTLSCKNG